MQRRALALAIPFAVVLACGPSAPPSAPMDTSKAPAPAKEATESDAKKACVAIFRLGKKNASTSEMDACVTEFDGLASKRPRETKCIARCMTEAKDPKQADSCGTQCKRAIDVCENALPGKKTECEALGVRLVERGAVKDVTCRTQCDDDVRQPYKDRTLESVEIDKIFKAEVACYLAKCPVP